MKTGGVWRQQNEGISENQHNNKMAAAKQSTMAKKIISSESEKLAYHRRTWLAAIKSAAAWRRMKNGNRNISGGVAAKAAAKAA
jgi:hypothetical protein